MKPAVENHQCGGGSEVEFHRRLERQADWDRCYGHQPYTTVWCTSGSKFSMSYLLISQLPTTQLHHHYFPTEYAYLSQGWMHFLAIHTLLPPQIDTDKALEPIIYIFFIAMALLQLL
jgi:hypothetical protein